MEIAASPDRRWRPRPSAAGAARLVLPAVILVTLLFELALAERKYALFGGGFGQSNRLDAPVETFLFAATLTAVQALAFYGLWRLMRLARRCSCACPRPWPAAPHRPARFLPSGSLMPEHPAGVGDPRDSRSAAWTHGVGDDNRVAGWI